MEKKSDFATWRTLMGYNGHQVKAAAEAIGITGRDIPTLLHSGKRELNQTERLAMAAVRAGLTPWTPEADQDIRDFAQVRYIIDQIVGREKTSNAA